jgi:hypothetical protein
LRTKVHRQFFTRAHNGSSSIKKTKTASQYYSVLKPVVDEVKKLYLEDFKVFIHHDKTSWHIAAATQAQIIVGTEITFTENQIKRKQLKASSLDFYGCGYLKTTISYREGARNDLVSGQGFELQTSGASLNPEK